MVIRKLDSKDIVVASHNAGKIREICELIKPFGLNASAASELSLAEPAETGMTFEENAGIKALAAASATGLPALADDSGLCVDALGGAPGVYTADWAEKSDGSGRDFVLAMEKVEQALAEKGAQQAGERNARFVSVLCLAWPDTHTEYFRGEVAGKLMWPPRGNLGFGYDPIFLPNGLNTTFGEMTAEEKHGWNPANPDMALSHRARAFAKFVTGCL